MFVLNRAVSLIGGADETLLLEQQYAQLLVDIGGLGGKSEVAHICELQRLFARPLELSIKTLCSHGAVGSEHGKEAFVLVALKTILLAVDHYVITASTDEQLKNIKWPEIVCGLVAREETLLLLQTVRLFRNFGLIESSLVQLILCNTVAGWLASEDAKHVHAALILAKENFAGDEEGIGQLVPNLKTLLMNNTQHERLRAKALQLVAPFITAAEIEGLRTDLRNSPAAALLAVFMRSFPEERLDIDLRALKSQSNAVLGPSRSVLDRMVRFATICASNMNRSMEAHHVLSKKGFDVCSFGTNSQVKMPGTSADRPNTYSFAQSYEHMYGDLRTKDADFYMQNGMLSILERNKKLKEKPQRFQSSRSTFDVIFTCEERCFDIVCESLRDRDPWLYRPVYIVNFDIPDTPEDAAIGARWILQLAQLLEDSQNLDEEIEGIVRDFQGKSPLPMLYSVHYY